MVMPEQVDQLDRRQRIAEAALDAIIAAVDGVGIRASLDPDSWPASRQRALLATLLHPLLGAGTSASATTVGCPSGPGNDPDVPHHASAANEASDPRGRPTR